MLVEWLNNASNCESNIEKRAPNVPIDRVTASAWTRSAISVT